MVLPGDKTHPLAPRTEAAASPQGPPHGPIHLEGSQIWAAGEGTYGWLISCQRLPTGQLSCQHSASLPWPSQGPAWLLRPGTPRPRDPHSDPGRRWAGGGQTPCLPLSILRPPCLNKGAAAGASQLAGGEGPAARPGFSEGLGAAAPQGPEPAADWACKAGPRCRGREGGPLAQGDPQAGTSRSGAYL